MERIIEQNLNLSLFKHTNRFIIQTSYFLIFLQQPDEMHGENMITIMINLRGKGPKQF